ncbi:MAG: hypothetical protein ABIA63_10990 [bacterium]
MDGKIELKVNLPETSAIKDLFAKAEDDIKKIFNVSLSDLLAQQQRYNKEFVFNI